MPLGKREVAAMRPPHLAATMTVHSMKYLILTALSVATLALGACAHHDSASMSTTHSTATTGYSK